MTADSQNKQFFDAAVQHAFPVSTIDGFTHYGLTARQYAAIALRVPDSGGEWLDAMIRTSLRDEFAAKAMQELLGLTFPHADSKVTAAKAYEYADAMLAERAK